MGKSHTSMTSVPPQDEPDINEVLIDYLEAASAAHREASFHFEAALPQLNLGIELHRQSSDIMREADVVSDEATEMLLEAIALVQENPQGNIVRAMGLAAQATAASRRARVISSQSYELTQQAASEITQGMTVWSEGSRLLREGLEQATTLLQASRRRQTNGGRPDAPAA